MTKLDQLIIHLAQPIRDNPDTRQRFVQITGSSGRAAKPGWRWPWQKQYYYAVAESDDRQHANVAERAPFRVVVAPATANTPGVELEIAYRAWCLPQQVNQFAEWHHEMQQAMPPLSLEAIFDDVLRKSIEREVRALPDGCSDENILRARLVDQLKSACSRLEFHVDIFRSPMMVQVWEAVEPLEIPVKFEDYNDPIVIQTKVLRLNLVDFRRNLFNAHHHDLKSWAALAVNEAARIEIATESYTKFLSEWTSVRDRIKARVVSFAEHIGYKVVALLNEPDTPEYDALRELKIEIDEEPFKTDDVTISVELSIHAVGRLRDLRQPLVEAAVRSHVTIQERLEETIVTVVQACMHEISANDFYHYFFVAGPHRKISVQDYLRTKVEEVLASYGVIGLADLSSEKDRARVSVKQGQSDVTATVADLMRTPIIIEGLSVPTAGTGQLTAYNFTFVVRGIRGDVQGAYARLAALVPLAAQRKARVVEDLESAKDPVSQEVVRKDIERTLKEVLLANLHTLQQYVLQYEQSAILHELQRCVGLLTNEFSAKEFGLDIRLQTIRRLSTTDETVEQHAILARSKASMETLELGLKSLGDSQGAWLNNQFNLISDESREAEHPDAFKRAEKFVRDRTGSSLTKKNAAKQNIAASLLGEKPKEPKPESPKPDET